MFWNPPPLTLMVYSMNLDLGVDLPDLGVDSVLLYLASDGGNMPVIQLIPREGLKSPKPGLDSCVKSLSTHLRAEESKDASKVCMVHTLNNLPWEEIHV